MAMFDLDMNYLAASLRWKVDCGLTGDVVGQNHYALFPKSISDDWKAVHLRAMSGETLYEDACARRSKSRPLERRRYAAAGGVKPGQW